MCALVTGVQSVLFRSEGPPHLREIIALHADALLRDRRRPISRRTGPRMVGGSRDPLGGVGAHAGGGLISASEVARSLVTLGASAAALIEHTHNHEKSCTIPDVTAIIWLSRFRCDNALFCLRSEVCE